MASTFTERDLYDKVQKCIQELEGCSEIQVSIYQKHDNSRDLLVQVYNVPKGGKVRAGTYKEVAIITADPSENPKLLKESVGQAKKLLKQRYKSIKVK